MQENGRRYGVDADTAKGLALIHSEMAADSMFDVFSNEKFIKDIVTENRTLAQKIRDFLTDLISELREMITHFHASEEMNALRNQTKALEDINASFISALESATQNMQETLSDKTKNTATKSGVRYSLKRELSKSDLEDNMNKVVRMKSVALLTGKEFEKSNVDLITQVEQFFDSIGNSVLRKYGSIELTRTGIKASIGHGIGRKEAIAFKGIPNVLMNGEIIDYQINWKGRGYDTAAFAAPITINDTDYYMVAIVNVEKEKNITIYMKLHYKNKKVICRSRPEPSLTALPATHHLLYTLYYKICKVSIIIIRRMIPMIPKNAVPSNSPKSHSVFWMKQKLIPTN